MRALNRNGSLVKIKIDDIVYIKTPGTNEKRGVKVISIIEDQIVVVTVGSDGKYYEPLIVLEDEIILVV
ncbi:hypothetical protein H8M44_18420 [Klebsiella pneumoniae]|nr:hypothetical protein [Klebsiella pneumoniae]